MGLSTIARLGEVSPLSPGVGTSPELFLGFGAGRTALKKRAGHAADRNNAPLRMKASCSPALTYRAGLRTRSPSTTVGAWSDLRLNRTRDRRPRDPVPRVGAAPVCGAQKPRTGPVTRSFFEFARPSLPRRPR